jgi:hypothetical protein
MNTSDNGKRLVYRTDFDPSEIPADIREFFVEVSAQCGAPWRRVTQETPEYAAVKATLRERLGPDFHMKRAGLDAVKGVGTGTNPATLPPKSTTTGWSPGCACDAAVVPCRVLDPFAGAGTTLLVADRLQRDAIGIELSTDYGAMAADRLTDDAPLLAWGAAQLAEAAE